MGWEPRVVGARGTHLDQGQSEGAQGGEAGAALSHPRILQATLGHPGLPLGPGPLRTVGPGLWPWAWAAWLQDGHVEESTLC